MKVKDVEKTKHEESKRQRESEKAMTEAQREVDDPFPVTRGATTGAAPATARSRSLNGLFRNRESAENAYRALAERGYSRDDVNIIMSDETRENTFATTTISAVRRWRGWLSAEQSAERSERC